VNEGWEKPVGSKGRSERGEGEEGEEEVPRMMCESERGRRVDQGLMGLAVEDPVGEEGSWRVDSGVVYEEEEE
jgi:hypothetical protein